MRRKTLQQRLAAAGCRFLTGLMAGVLVGTALVNAARADELGDQLQRFLHDDAFAVVHFRTEYLDRTNPPPTHNNAAWAGGGWVGLFSGWFYDTVQLGAVGYTTQPFWAPPPTSDGTQLLKPGGYGFFTLGQAFVSVRSHDQVFTAYRQLLNELEVNPNDSRGVPQTFEAYALSGPIGPITYFAGSVASIKPRDASAFINMGERAGASNVNSGMLLGTLRYGDLETVGARASVYHVADILTSGYADGAATFSIADDLRVRLMGQFMVQGSNGTRRLTGQSFSTFVAGGRANLIWGPLSLFGVYTQTGSTAAYRAPYGVWIGYTAQLIKDFDRAGDRAFQTGAAFDFTRIGLPGLLFVGSATFADRAIDATNGRPLANTNEYDLELAMRADLVKNVPDWLKPLQIRVRAGFVDQFLNGTANSIQEYRAYLNYEVTFSGKKRPASAGP